MKSAFDKRPIGQNVTATRRDGRRSRRRRGRAGCQYCRRDRYSMWNTRGREAGAGAPAGARQRWPMTEHGSAVSGRWTVTRWQVPDRLDCRWPPATSLCNWRSLCRNLISSVWSETGSADCIPL